MDCLKYPFAMLETLNLSGNCLVSLDVSRIPNLRRLYLDRNAISSVRGITSLKSLETLCWREQNLMSRSDFPEIQYQDCYNVHHLYISSNILSSFSPSTTFLNLRTLEIASTGLQTLSPHFGHRVPNLRTLNLNYNAIRDLRPLVGIVRLQTLLLAGNRISRLRQTSAAFRRINSALDEIDLRQNPLTVGFYTPQETLVSSASGKQITLHSHHNPTSTSATSTSTSPTTAIATSSRSQTQPHPPPQPQPQSDETSPSPDLSPSPSQHSHYYTLPPLSLSADAQSCARLDKDTQLRRRVYEMMIGESCPRLKSLDGLLVEGRKQWLTRGGDEVRERERLSELGVL